MGQTRLHTRPGLDHALATDASVCMALMQQLADPVLAASYNLAGRTHILVRSVWPAQRLEYGVGYYWRTATTEAKQLKPIFTLVTGANRITNETPKPNAEIHRILELAIKYHHTAGVARRLGHLDYDNLGLESFVTASLQEDFFEHLYVDTGDPDELVEGLNGRLVALTGERGIGKSTLLLYVLKCALEDPRFRPADSVGTQVHAVEYFDVQRLEPRLRLRAENHYFDLCHIVFQDLLNKFVPVAEPIFDDWETFLFDHLDHFSLLQQRLTRKMSAQRVAILDAISPDGGDRSEFDECSRRFNSEEGLPKLRALVQFLLEHRHTRLSLIIDNVDHYPNKYQVDVAQHLAQLASGDFPIAGAIVSLRSENFDKVKEALAGLNFMSRQPFSGPQARTETARFESFLEKRVLYAEQLTSLTSTQNSKEGSSYFDRVRRLLHAKRAAETFTGILLWHNHSFRTSAQSVHKLFDSLLFGPNSLYRFAVLRDAVSTTDALEHARLAHSLTFRHLIFDDDASDPLLAGTDLLLNADNEELAEEDDHNFLRLFVMLALRNLGHPVTEGELVELFASVGITPIRTHAAVVQLSKTRGIDETGFVRLDSPRHEEGALRSFVEVISLPALEFALEHLVASCEYLFWCAMYHRNGDHFLTRENSGDIHYPTQPDVENEAYRIEIAIRYLELEVLPSLTLWANRTLLLPDGVERLGRFLNQCHVDSYADYICGTVGAYAEISREIGPVGKEKISARLEELRSQAAQLRPDPV